MLKRVAGAMTPAVVGSKVLGGAVLAMINRQAASQRLDGTSATALRAAVCRRLATSLEPSEAASAHRTQQQEPPQQRGTDTGRREPWGRRWKLDRTRATNRVWRARAVL